MGNVRLIGLDPGFGGTKFAEVVDGQMVTCQLPSVVGVGNTDTGALGLAGVINSKRRGAKPYRVAFDGVEYLVGHNVHRYARPSERMEMTRFSEGPELRALLYAALFQLLNGGGHTLALAVGLPVEVLEDEATARAVERDLRGWLVGRHEFTLDGTPAVFEVVQVRAKIAQPLCTWLDWGMDNNGQWVRGVEAAKAPCLVIDEGFNTLDISGLEGKAISARYTSGDRLGMRRAAEMTASNIEQRYNVELSLHEADALVRQVVIGKKARTYVQGERVDVTPLVRQAVNALATEVMRFIERNVGKGGGRFKMLLAGGGALALAPRIIQEYAHAAVVPDPVLANARGLAKLAARPGFLI